MKPIAACLFLLTAIASAASAEQMVMLPFEPSVVYGKGGITWRTFLVAVNSSDRNADFRCSYALCSAVPPRSYYVFQGAGVAGNPAFLYFDDDLADSVHIALRVYVDGSGPHTARIMELPVARAADFRSDVMRIAYIPVGGNARQSLRIYDREGRDGTTVRLEILGAGSHMVDTVVTLHEAFGQMVGSGPARPATIEINDLSTAFPELADVDTADIIITPMTPGAHIWAFVTSTSNDSPQFNHFTP